MGMCGEYLRLDEKTLKAIKKGKTDFFDLSESLLDKQDERILSVDKIWHVIHFVLSGTAWEAGKEPISKMVLSGNALNEETDYGYGPAVYLKSKDVCKISKAAEVVGSEWFKARFNIAEMYEKEIYLIDSIDEPAEELFEEAWSVFQEIREFYKKAAACKQAMVFSIC